MAAIITLLAVIALSLLIVRIGTVALMMTGLSEEVASFQSLSAFSGAGFTTGESESVVLTQARRKILKYLIRAGSAGVVTVIASLILSFGGEGGTTARQFLVLGIGMVVMVYLTQSRWFDRLLLTPVIRWVLRKSAAVELRDYATLLHLGKGGHTVAELTASGQGFLVGKAIDELGLTERGVTVLGVSRADDYLGAPERSFRVERGDRLVLYGEAAKLVEFAFAAHGDHVKSRPTPGEHDETVQRLGEEDHSAG